MGSHRPNIHKIKMKDKYVRRIVLGDWYKVVMFYFMIVKESSLIDIIYLINKIVTFD